MNRHRAHDFFHPAFILFKRQIEAGEIAHSRPLACVSRQFRRPVEAQPGIPALLHGDGSGPAVRKDRQTLDGGPSGEHLGNTRTQVSFERIAFRAYAGALVIAVGSDAPGKQELDAGVLARADKIVVDHREQSLKHGEMQHSTSAACIHAELGEVAAGLHAGRVSCEEIIAVDLTGVGIQDAAVANEVVRNATAVGDA